VKSTIALACERRCPAWAETSEGSAHGLAGIV
jgi:hypothetical protein